MKSYKEAKEVFNSLKFKIIKEGNYNAIISKVEYNKAKNTEYGLKETCTIYYEVKIGITTQEKKEVFYVGGKGARWIQFLNEFFNKNIPEIIDIYQFVNRPCILTFIHDQVGDKIYANIERRVFNDEL